MPYVNIKTISRLISLAKKAKEQAIKGKLSASQRLIRLILSLEKRELLFIRNVSGSSELHRQCQEIYDLTKATFTDVRELEREKVIVLLDRIIKLENIKLEKVQEKENLPKEVLEDIDPYIKDLVKRINTLGFVKKTMFSCSGHIDKGKLDPYISIEYDLNYNNPSGHLLWQFHKEMQKICPLSGFVVGGGFESSLIPLDKALQLYGKAEVVYYLIDRSSTIWKAMGFLFSTKKKIMRIIIKKWHLISRLVERYQPISSLTYQKEKIKKPDSALLR